MPHNHTEVLRDLSGPRGQKVIRLRIRRTEEYLCRASHLKTGYGSKSVLSL